MGRQKQKNDVIRSARCKHFTGSKRRAPKKNNSRSSDVRVSGQSESVSRRTCKWRSRHPSRQGYFKQRCAQGMARQDKSSSLLISRTSPKRRYCELWRSKFDVDQRCAEGYCIATWRGSAKEEVRKHRDRASDRSLETNQPTKTTSRCKLWLGEYSNGSTAWYILDEESFKYTCINDKEKRGGVHQPFYGAQVTDFMLKQDA